MLSITIADITFQGNFTLAFLLQHVEKSPTINMKNITDKFFFNLHHFNEYKIEKTYPYHLFYISLGK